MQRVNKSVALWDRLHGEAETRDRKFEAIQQLKTAREELLANRMATVSRQVVEKSRPPNDDLLRKAYQRRMLKKIQYKAISSPIATPRIDSRSDRIAKESGRLNRTVVERLYSVRENTPATPTSTRTPNSNSGDVSKPTEFLDRQREDANARVVRQQIRSRRAARECTFTPTVKNRETSHRAEVDIFKRLAVEDPRRRAESKERQKRAITSQLTFIPQIDAFSEALVSSRRPSTTEPVYHRLSKRTKAESVEYPQSESSVVEQPVYPQKPTKFPHVRSRYDMKNPSATLAVLDAHRKQRAHRLELERQQAVNQELSECTFQPNTRKGSVPTARSVVQTPVSGTARYLELKQRAIALSERNRVSQMREYEPIASPNVSMITVPDPFKLQQSSHIASYCDKLA